LLLLETIIYFCPVYREQVDRALTSDEVPHVTVTDETVQDDNERLECGQSVDISVTLKNWWAPVEQLVGTLTCSDPNIVIDTPTASWGAIGTEESIESLTYFHITDNSVEPRCVGFTLTFTALDTPPDPVHFSLLVYPNSSDPMVTLPLLAGECITTDISASDIDYDGIDELVIGTSESRIFIVDYPNVWTFDAGNAGEAITPAIGELNNDGYQEIVAAFNCGDVYILDRFGTQMNHFTTEAGPRFAVCLEDVTGDDQFEIILQTMSDPVAGTVKLVVMNPLTGEYECHVFDGLSALESMMVPFCVADVDQDGRKEIIMPVKTSTADPTLFLVKVESDLTIQIDDQQELSYGDNSVYFLSRPIVADVDEDGYPEILTYSQEYTTSGPAYLDAWHYSTQQGFTMAGQYVHVVGGAIGRVTMAVGNLLPNVPGLEILLPSRVYTHLVSSELSQIDIFDAIINNPLLADMNLDGVQEIFNVSNYNLYSAEGEKIEEWGLTGIIYSCAIARPRSTYEKELVVVRTFSSPPGSNGILASMPFDFGETSLVEWGQYLNNARHTNSYFQPLPEEATDTDITITNPVILSHSFRLIADNVLPTLTIDGPMDILCDKNVTFSVTGNVEIDGSSRHSVRFIGHGNVTSDSWWNGIVLENKSNSEINYLKVQNASTGLTYNETGSHFLNYSELANNHEAVCCYNSLVYFYANVMERGRFGLTAFHKAAPYLGIGIPSGYNTLMNNTVGLYSDESSPNVNNGHNNFVSNTSYNMETYPSSPLRAEHNWWGSTDEHTIEAKFNDPTEIDYIPFDLTYNTLNRSGEDMSVYEEAMANLLNGNYSDAEIGFKSVIEDGVDSNDDAPSLAGLFVCYKENGILSELDTYIVGLLEGTPTEDLEKSLLNTQALTNRGIGEYSDAMLHYEAIIENPDSYADSCYAVIDLGNTYLECSYRTIGTMPQFCPESYESHKILTQNLLASILSGNTGNSGTPVSKRPELYPNYPNPFNPTTTIRFSIPNDSQVKLSIYNIRGQRVTTLVNDTLTPGYHEAVWNGTDSHGRCVSSGVYFYRLDTGNKAITKKMLLLK